MISHLELATGMLTSHASMCQCKCRLTLCTSS